MSDSMDPRRFYDEEADWERGRRRSSFLSEIASEGTLEYLDEFFPEDGCEDRTVVDVSREILAVARVPSNFR